MRSQEIISHRSYNYSKELANINYFPVTFTFIIALLYCIFLNNTLNYFTIPYISIAYDQH